MADIELVIKIPEELYEMQLRDDWTGNVIIHDAIVNGTPLPKGHGRLIDADAYYDSIKKHYFDNSTVMECTEIALDNAPTIIEANKESEQNDN